MAARQRMTYMQHQRRLRYWRDYYRRNRSSIYKRPGKTVITTAISSSFREATPAYQRVIQGRHRVKQSKSNITRLRLSIAGKRRQPPFKERVAILLGTRHSAQLRRGSRMRKGI